MKKVYDYTIPIKISLPDAKKNISLDLSIHTRIKEINDIITEKIGFQPFSTNINFICKRTYERLDHISTLLQNNIKPGDTLIAYLSMTSKQNKSRKIKMVKKLTDLEIIAKEYNFGKINDIYGLIIEGMCPNSKCLLNGKDQIFPLGTGTFSLDQILNELKCPICPYKDQAMNKQIIIKNIKFVNCYFQCRGSVEGERIRGKSKELKKLWKIEGEDSDIFYKILDENKWITLVINVKHL